MEKNVIEKPYWHEASEMSIRPFFNGIATWEDVMNQYRQPNWCMYVHALNGTMGCWSLTGDNRSKISPEFCKGCECFNPKKAI